jgi:hypothetical protein
MLILAAILGILVYGIVAATWGNWPPLNPTLGFNDAQNGERSRWRKPWGWSWPPFRLAR